MQHHSSGSTSSEQSAAGDSHLARNLAPSFSGWSDQQMLHPHRPGDLSSGGSHHQHHHHHQQLQLQQQDQPPSLQGVVLFQHAVEAAAAAAAAHCSLFAAGGLQQQRVRRKSTSDAAPHHVPGSLAARRRKSDGGLRASTFAPHVPLFLAGLAAAAADGGSQPSSTGSSSPGVSVSLDAEHTTYLEVDAFSAGAASSQHHQLTPVTEGVPLTQLEVTPPASPGRAAGNRLQQQQHEQQCQQQEQQLQQELLHLQQMAQQKQAELELLKQQQHLSESRRSPTPPSYGSWVPNICVSPRGAAGYRPLGAGSSAAGGSASGGGSRRAATEPLLSHSGSAASGSGGRSHGSGSSSQSCGYSPGAAAMVMTNSSSSTGTGRQGQQQQQQLQQAQLDAANAAAAASASPSAAGGRVQPVARDITQRLQMQRPASAGGALRQLPAAAAGPGTAADLEHSSIWGSWSGHGLTGSSAAQASLQAFEQQQQQQGQLQAAAVHSQRGAASSSDQQQPGLAAASVRPRPAPQRSRSSTNIAKSPAPPSVPPSPQQHAVAELRNRRSSCSSIPATPSGMLATPSPRPVLSYGDWGHSAAASVAAGQGQVGERRAGSSSTLDAGPKLTVRVVSPETESLWSAYYAAGQSSPRSAYDEAQGSSGSGLDPVPEQQQQQQDAHGSTGFLSMQEQRLAQRNEARGMLAAEGSGRETPGSGSSIKGGLSDTSCHQLQQGSCSKALSSGQWAGPHKAGPGAALPPPHPPLSQQADVPGTPRGHMSLNPQHAAPRSASVAAAAASGLAQLHQPQHPVPPRQHAPSCRSPCVSSRQHVAQISPAAAAWLGKNGALTGQHSSCSPILEQGPYGNPSSNPSSAGSCRAAGSYSRASPVAGSSALLEGGTLSSSGSTGGLGPMGRLLGGGTPSAAATPGSGSGSSSAKVNLPGALPRPAFDQLARAVSFDASFLQQQQQQHMQLQQQQQQPQQPSLRSPSPPAAPDATATIYGCGRPMRACSPLVKKMAAGLSSTGGSSSGSQQADEQQRLQRLQVPKSPSPPPMGAAAMIAASPRVQPCPPVNSLPPVSPSPSVRTRLLGQQHTSSQGTPEHQAPPALVSLAAPDVAAAEAQAGAGAGMRAVRMPCSEPEWAGSSPVVNAPPAAAKSLTFSTTAGAAAAPAAADTRGAQGLAATLSRPGRLLQPQLPASPAARGDGTPDMAWLQPAGAVRAAAPGGVLDRAAPQPCSNKQPAAADSCALSTAGSVGSTAAGRHQGPAGWAGAAVVVAFSHYRGRLGYLMNSGVVGVLMEDASMMLVQGDDMRTVCYIQPPAAAVSTAAVTSRSSPVSSHDASPAGKDTRQGPALTHSRSRAVSADTDVGQSDQAASGPGMAAAAAAAAAAPSSAKQGPPAAQLFRLSEQLVGTHSSSAGGSSSPASSSSVPEHLASKVRCVQRFVGCLVHHQPYSSKRHLDVTRLVLPGPWGLQDWQQQQQGQQQGQQQQQQQGQQGSLSQRELDSSWVHVQHFNYSEGCVLLTLTDGSQQLVFTSDSSVLLLHPGMQQLAYVTPPRRRQRQASRPGSSSSSQHDGVADAAAVLSCSDSDSDGSSGSDSDAAGSGPGAAEVVVLKLGAGCVDMAGLQDPRLLARLKHASCLPGVLPFDVCVG